MNALADDKVADYINENFVATFLKVGTFQIINGQKVGGNVASYFCQSDGTVLHAVPGKVDGRTLLDEARWAVESRKLALTHSTNLATGAVDKAMLKQSIRRSHQERFAQTNDRPKFPGVVASLPPALPMHVSQQAQAHWLLAMTPLASVTSVYPFVWERILREKLSGLPVAQSQ